MDFLTVAQVAERWGLSERSVRSYCAQGRVPGAILAGRSWLIPADAEKPSRQPRSRSASDAPGLLDVLRREKDARLSGGIYHYVQIELTYNSNHIEGSRLTHEQTRYIFETNTIGVNETVSVDDIVETVNHFQCVDHVIDTACRTLTQNYLKGLHRMLKAGTTDSRKSWFATGDYKRLPNEVGGQPTAEPKEVEPRIRALLEAYETGERKSFEDIVAFHVALEKIHPFQDGNGRVGRLVMFKECLRNGVVPFIITDELKMFYYRGLHEWSRERGYLLDTCLTAQDAFVEVHKRFGLGL